LNRDRSLWLLRAQLLFTKHDDYDPWRDAVTVFARGDEFMNDDGEFILVQTSSSKGKELFKRTATSWQITKKPSKKELHLSLNVWDCIVLGLPPFPFSWGALGKFSTGNGTFSNHSSSARKK
jgi:hypothetical protein